MANIAGLVGAGSQALTSILGGKTRVQFIQNNKTVITLDASINETHTRESPPTEFPVESGPTVSDHIIVKPFALEITGIISDTPIGGLGGLLQEAATSLATKLIPPAGISAVTGAMGLISSLAGSKSPSVAAYGQIIQLQQNGQPFDVLTTLYRYPNMWIKSISVPRDAQNGNVLLFTVNLVQLLLVTPQSVNVQIFANPALSANNADVGNQANGISNGFAAGYSDTTSGIKAITGGGGYVGSAGVP
jgi:hypothetical protein